MVARELLWGCLDVLVVARVLICGYSGGCSGVATGLFRCPGGCYGVDMQLRRGLLVSCYVEV